MFKWKDEYSCNIKEIDKQHQKLFEIGSRLYELATLDDDIDRYDEMMEILSELADYTIYHFGYEEKLMKKYGYEDLEQHKKQHKGFVNKIMSIKSEELDENQKKMGMDMVVFIANWIENHILKSDQRYKEFFNKNGVY